MPLFSWVDIRYVFVLFCHFAVRFIINMLLHRHTLLYVTCEYVEYGVSRLFPFMSYSITLQFCSVSVYYYLLLDPRPYCSLFRNCLACRNSLYRLKQKEAEKTRQISPKQI